MNCQINHPDCSKCDVPLRAICLWGAFLLLFFYGCSSSPEHLKPKAELPYFDEVLVQRGHGISIGSMALDDQARYLWTSGGKTIKKWDMNTGQMVRSLKFPEGSSFNMGLLPGSRQAVVVDFSGPIRIMDLESGRWVRSFSEKLIGTTSMAVTPDGKSVLVGGNRQTLTLWDVASGTKVRLMDESRSSWTVVAVSPDGALGVSGTREGALKLWSMEDGEQRLDFEGHRKNISSVQFSADGSKVISGSYDGTAKIWDVETGRLLHSFEEPKTNIFGIDLSSDGKYLLVGSHRILRLWDVNTERQIRTYPIPLLTTLNSLLTVSKSLSKKEMAELAYGMCAQAQKLEPFLKGFPGLRALRCPPMGRTF